MSKKAVVLAAKIFAELREISILVDRALKGWEKAKRTSDDYYLDSVALNLHGFYSGLERVFERIASEIDNTIPEGANWHRELLNQMGIEIPDIRPAVISDTTIERLEAFRGFRHVVRNVYTFRLKPEKLETLVSELNLTFLNVENDLKAFTDFLRIKKND